ncbi:hypothetical protein ACFXPI_06250 [Streptomyces sp. NPDC059104]|uniref:hypothetical protein n=1 Tax=unclassified Streptomyces TaxID=2593676 RepID=UPI0033B80D20
MGVFSRFRRRKDETSADSAAAEAVTEPAEPEAEVAEEAKAEPSATEAPAAEAVEIPKQQSVEAAADSEAGEGART